MRLANLKSLFCPARLKKLTADFKTPYKALLAASGLLRRPLRLTTVENLPLTVDRGDLPVWDEYFNSRHCHVSISGSLFHITPANERHPVYYIKGGTNSFTYCPRRWNDGAYRSPLVSELELHEYSVYSQHGEDGILQTLFAKLPVDHKFIVEFGAHDGIKMSNSRYWINEQGWSAFLIESDRRFFRALSELYAGQQKIRLLRSLVTPENIDALFSAANVPHNFEILSIDIDSIDFYVWEGLSTFRPKVVVIESNPSIPPGQDYVVPRDKALDYGGSSREGASIAALHRLGVSKGYQLIYSELSGANLFFVDNPLVSYLDAVPLSPEELYQPPQYGMLAGTTSVNGRGYT